MLRITLLRLKKVCSNAFIPRILGGEQCGAPVCYAGIRKAPHRTKTSDDGKQNTTDNKSDAHGYTFASGTEFKTEDKSIRKGDEDASFADKIANESSRQVLSARLPLTSREKCQRIIEKAFGKTDHTETGPVLGEQYFSHTVNLDHTRREIHESEKQKVEPQEPINIDNPVVPDDRSQFGIFKMSRELIKDDDLIIQDPTLNASPRAGRPGRTDTEDLDKTLNMTLAREPDLTKHLETAKGTAEEALTFKEPNIIDAKQEVEKCVNNPESVEKKTACDDDAETIEIVKDERKLDLYQEAIPPFQTPRIINATTVKEEEEQLTQKLETIDETPIVEAQNPKIEGFNVTPRVLGEQAILDYKGIEANHDAFDEMAKRCMNSPLGQIDEMLLDEMENVGISNTRKTENAAPSTAIMEDDLVQMDILTKQTISHMERQDLDSEGPASEKIDQLNEEVEAEDVSSALRTSEEVAKPAAEEEKYNILYPDHIRIQLQPLVTISCDPEEYNFTDGCHAANLPYYYLPATQRALEMNYQEIENETLLIKSKSDEGDVKETEKQGLADNPAQDLEETTCDATAEEEMQSIAPLPSAQCAPPSEEMEIAPAQEINPKATSFDPLNDASDNIGHLGLLKPDYNSYIKGVRKPSYYETMNASQNAAKTSADANSLYVTEHQKQEASASIERNIEQNKEEEETTEIKRSEETTPPCSEDKRYLIEESQPKEEPVSKRTSIPDEILKQHELDPYYVLTCNETCPISPGSAMSSSENTDFVDTSETIYMKKNICESLRPKPNDMTMSCETMAAERQAKVEEALPKPEAIPETKITPNTIEIPPSPGEQVALTELLKRVRNKSRLQNRSKNLGVTVRPLEGKCGRKAPRCPPTAPRSPPLNPVPPPTFGLPMLKRRPPVCKSKRKPGSNKCSACDMDVACGVQLRDRGPEMAYELSEAEVCAIRSRVDLTDVVIDHLQNLGNIFSGIVRQVRANVETLLARDFEPWSPIPSWPIPQKVEKKKSQPGMHGVPPCETGCPLSPKARASMNPEPPCNLKPCEGFPKRSSFSSLDCFAVSLGESKVYDLGSF